ncbi:MAG: hypothetical protein Q9226_007278 [Calogaya cf. arnoldii]
MVILENNVDEYRKRLSTLQKSDLERTKLIEDLIRQVEQLSDENDELYGRLADALKDRRKSKPQITLQVTPQVKPEENHVTFHDTFLNQGQRGGWKASAELLRQINNDLEHNLGFDISNLEVKILAYANLKGLRERRNNTWVKRDDKWVEKKDKRVIRDVDMIRFAHGFTAANPLIDFIDVSPGKERTHQKIKGFQTTLGWETVD